MEYGLIGSRLGHSYSKIIHQRLCGYDYQLLALPTEAEARRFLEEHPFRAINVTIPYKRLAMDACDQVDPRAAAIGAVNTVVNRDGRLYGYNTDYMGFAHLCRSHGVDFRGRTVLILGTGGTHNTVAAVARDAGAARVLTVSRKPGPGQLSYREAAGAGGQILINTTPAGMYPDVGTCLLDTDALRGMEAVLDVVYNPVRTELLLRAGEAGVPVRACGLEMLVAQAVYAAEYLNVSLVGMPSSGKTTLGRLLAEKLGRTFVDLDEEIVRAAGRSIPDLFAAEGEAGFRRREAEQAARFGKESGLLISCGGGIVKNAANIRALRQNGVVLFIDRPLEELTVGGGRPLSSSPEALRQMEKERRPFYLGAADAVIPNDGTVQQAVGRALDALEDLFAHE